MSMINLLPTTGFQLSAEIILSTAQLSMSKMQIRFTILKTSVHEAKTRASTAFIQFKARFVLSHLFFAKIDVTQEIYDHCY